MNTPPIGLRIKQRREELGLTQEELAEKLHYKTKSSINKIEKGVNDLPRTKVADFAVALQTSVSYLMGWVNDPDPKYAMLNELGNKVQKTIDKLPNSTDYWFEFAVNDSTNGVRIPVLGRVAAGIPIYAEENIIDWEEIPQEMSKKGEYFCLEIRGHSMEPRIYDGDVVIVHKQPDAESGQIAIVSVNGDDATCKRLVKYENGITLMSFNPSYAPMVFTDKEKENLPLQIWGIVEEVRGKLKGI